ncbi:hypothetical protein [Nonomuraea angiospora]|uniref:hypothetical protein n=1 Tax=Nonomuraea angiospora TaxID=46172 RepID=UPI0029B478CC|nr:hypothetical protein [Nonomuraea angiospora]MDX3100491.1 hypothetical protein [Nonomuraea angiospora]
MLKFLYDVPTTATVELLAESEHTASEIIDAYQGARFETRAIDGASDDYRKVELIELSTIGPAALVAVWQDTPVPAGEVGPAPTFLVALPDAALTELEEQLTAWDRAADGASGDDEHDAAAALADSVRAMLKRAKGGAK